MAARNDEPETEANEPRGPLDALLVRRPSPALSSGNMFNLNDCGRDENDYEACYFIMVHWEIMDLLYHTQVVICTRRFGVPYKTQKLAETRVFLS